MVPQEYLAQHVAIHDTARPRSTGWSGSYRPKLRHGNSKAVSVPLKKKRQNKKNNRRPKQSKFHLEVTSGVHEDVGRLEIPVDHSRRVHVVQPAEDLVEEELQVRLLKILSRVDYVMQVLLAIGRGGITQNIRIWGTIILVCGTIILACFLPSSR